MQVANKNHPDIIQLGDIKNWKDWNIEQPDLIMGGSPCQGFSFAGKQLAFDDPRSRLFFTMMDVIKHYKPRFRFLENVKMKKEYLDVITEH
jgi:site-specific DNA-cytosine methylase